jgi:hypothetical protein
MTRHHGPHSTVIVDEGAAFHVRHPASCSSGQHLQGGKMPMRVMEWCE